MVEDGYELYMTRGPLAGQSFALGVHNLTIGRDSLSDIVVRHAEISRQHALISIDRSGDYLIQDLGSTNGTFLDGYRLDNNPKTLRPSQLIALGSAVTFIFRRKEGVASSEPAEVDVYESEPAEVDVYESEKQQPFDSVDNAVAIEDRANAVQRPAETIIGDEEAWQEELIAQTPLREQRESQHQYASNIDAPSSTPTVRKPNLILGLMLLLLCCSASLLLFVLLLGGDWLFRLAGFVP